MLERAVFILWCSGTIDRVAAWLVRWVARVLIIENEKTLTAGGRFGILPFSPIDSEASAGCLSHQQGEDSKWGEHRRAGI